MPNNQKYSMDRHREAVRKRLNQICSQLYGGNKAEMARRLDDYERTRLTRALNGDTKKIDPEIIARIVEDGVSHEWLVSGDGAMLTDGVISVNGTPSDDETVQEIVDIPVLSVEVGAGPERVPVAEEREGYIPLTRSFIRREIHVPEDRLCWLTVTGNSMEPTLRPGQHVLVALITGEPIVEGGIYVVRLDEGLVIKRLFPIPGKMMLVASDNPDVPEYEVDLNDESIDFDVVAQLKWGDRKF